VRKIAEDHGGGVGLESAPEGGTRARLWLPARSLETLGTPAGSSAALP